MVMSKAGGYLRLMRPTNCVMMGFAVIVGAVLANPSGVSLSWQNLVLGFVTGFMLTAASMAINDYYDEEVDSVNEPKRPIPSGVIKSREALVFASVLTLVGFAAAYLTNALCFIVGIIAWMIFVAYTTIGKRSGLPGNFLVSACVAIPFVYGSIVIVSAVRTTVWIFAFIAFLSNTGREITKGIVDVEGDRMRGIKTLAVRFGEKTAAIAAALFYLSAVALSPVPVSLHLVSFWFLPFVLATDFGLVASSLMVVKDFSRENARRVKRVVLLWFVLGLLAFVAGAFG
jgi:geranylgeranylglycerol-phosphate geranylgeranyltransferase